MNHNSLDKKYTSKVMCKVCQQETWHSILNQIENKWDDDKQGMWEIITFYTLQCLGCDNVCLLISTLFSEDIDPRTGIPEPQIAIHPSPYKSARDVISKLSHVPRDVQSIYEEAIKAFNSGMMILAAIGIRTTIEAIAIEQKIIVRGIESKINKMTDQKIITSDGAKLLLLVKDIGNLATHEIKKHHRDDLALCIDIIEDVIRSLYILPKEALHTREIIDGNWKRVE